MNFFISNSKNIDQLVFIKSDRPVRNLTKEHINTNKESSEEGIRIL
jgi:hypothetical protein